VKRGDPVATTPACLKKNNEIKKEPKLGKTAMKEKSGERATPKGIINQDQAEKTWGKEKQGSGSSQIGEGEYETISGSVLGANVRQKKGNTKGAGKKDVRPTVRREKPREKPYIEGGERGG